MARSGLGALGARLGPKQYRGSKNNLFFYIFLSSYIFFYHHWTVSITFHSSDSITLHVVWKCMTFTLKVIFARGYAPGCSKLEEDGS